MASVIYYGVRLVGLLIREGPFFVLTYYSPALLPVLYLLSKILGFHVVVKMDWDGVIRGNRAKRLVRALPGVFGKDGGGPGLEGETGRYARFMENAAEVASALRGLDYAFFKFLRPLRHVSVDLDVLVRAEHVAEAARRLLARGFRPVVIEPYTITLERRGFIVDLYTHPSFAWAVYLDGGRLLDEAEEGDVWGERGRLLTRPAEVVVAAAHAVYKEHIYLLMDYFVVKRWLDKRAVSLAEELGVGFALGLAAALNDAIEAGAIEAPYKFPPGLTARVLTERFVNCPAFRGSSLNFLKLAFNKRTPGLLLSRLRRASY
ncbi:MAG: hypothetical protein QXT13_02090 [Pyrobaculum sp.]